MARQPVAGAATDVAPSTVVGAAAGTRNAGVPNVRCTDPTPDVLP